MNHYKVLKYFKFFAQTLGACIYLCFFLHLRHLQDDDDEEEVVFSLQQRTGEEDEGEVWPNANLVEVAFQRLYPVEIGFQRLNWVEVAFIWGEFSF